MRALLTNIRPVACTITVLRLKGTLQIVASLIDDARVVIYDTRLG